MKEFIEWLSKHSEVTVEFSCFDGFGYDSAVNIRMYYIDVLTRKRYCVSRIIDRGLAFHLDCCPNDMLVMLDSLYEKLKEQINEKI